MNYQDRYNSERYLDMTAYLALRNIEREERRLRMREDWIYRRGDVYLANAKQRIANLESLEEFAPQTSQLDRFLNEPSLTYDMAHAFVEAVYIYPDGTTEICWKFKDFPESNL